VDIVAFDLGFLPDLYRICLLTGDDGQDARGLYRDGDLLGHFYAAPYGVLEPASCFMLVDGDGACGYIVGTTDSVSFGQRMNLEWLPALRERLPPPEPADMLPDARMIRRIHAGYATPVWAGAYPAHLHIDLLPRAQRQGHGRRLVQRFLAHLQQQRVPGVHLGVGAANTTAIAFYEHLGFRCLEETSWGRWYGLALTDDLRPA
jgi:ribosomal protein S18 acetylase RimI-like enzyme